MQNDNGLKSYYLGIYNELKKSEMQAKEMVRTALPFENTIKNLIKEIKKARKQLHEIFSHPVIYQICSQCHKQYSGGCCQTKTDSYMLWKDLVYMAAEDLSFNLPNPDTEFLTSLKNYGCLFLSSQGCLLGVKRPLICITSICELDLPLGIKRLIGDGVLSENQISNLSNELNKNTRLLYVRILNKILPSAIDNDLINYGILHATQPLNINPRQNLVGIFIFCPQTELLARG